MRDVVLLMGVSIDGKVSGGPGSDVGGGGAEEHPDVTARKLGWVAHAGLHAMGRITYEGMASVWPNATGEYAKPMNEIPKVVFSRTLTRADWSTTTIASGDLAEEVAELKAGSGGEIIVYGGFTLAQALTRADLVDEYRLITRPVALGSGEPMFQGLAEERRLALIDVSPYPDGTVISIYRRETTS